MTTVMTFVQKYRDQPVHLGSSLLLGQRFVFSDVCIILLGDLILPSWHLMRPDILCDTHRSVVDCDQ